MRGLASLTKGVSRSRLMAGASVLTLFAAGLHASPAKAQATPGSAKCPIVNRIVTCSGSIPEGISVPAGSDRDGLTVENMTSDVTVTTRPAIAFTAGTPTSTIRIVDTDNALRLTTTGTDILNGGLDRSTGVVLATAVNNTTFSLLSDIDIFGTHGCAANCSSFRSNALPSGILVRGSRGNFAIDNRGDITIDIIDRGAGVIAGGIVADIFNADLVSIRNVGTVSVRNGTGIRATADNRRIEITNDGTVLTRGDMVTAFSYGIFLNFDSDQRYADGYTRPDVPPINDFTYRIVNNGTVRGVPTPANSFDFLPAIVVSSEYSEDLGNNGTAVYNAGRQTGEIVNTGTLVGTDGIYASQNGDLTITNSGRIDALSPTGQGDGTAIYAEQILSTVGTVGGVPLTRVVNAASGVITTNGPATAGISVNGGVLDISNAGRIAASGDGSYGVQLAGSSASSVRRSIQLVTFANTGDLLATGTTATALGLFRNNPASSNRAPDQRTVITNSGTIAATGNNAYGMYLEHRTTSADASLANIGTIDIDLSATSVVRGGSGTGVGIAFVAGERSTLRNAGLITATSGIAITGGSGAETIDNTGRVEGSVSLGAGNDRVIARGGGLYTAAIDGGDGNDTLQFDVATGSALISDRIGGAISGFELLEKTGAGTLALTQAVAPRAALLGGTLVTTGGLGGLAVDASAGTTLEATGTLGAVTVANGATFSPGGGAVGTIAVASLSLGASSRLRFDLGAPGTVGGAANDLISVAGNLTLDGLLDVNAQPNFGDGVYRLINYGGALTDNGLAIGNAPATSYQIQTSTAGQVNLVVGGVSMQFWDGGDTAADGTVDGGSGAWNTTATNWTRSDGTVNERWGSQFAVFQATPGTVTIDAGGVSASGLQFAVSGYTVTGGALTLTAPATVRVGDGSAAGAGYTATIASAIGGTGGIDKTDLGTLILTGTNGFTGGVRIGGGAVQVSADAALGATAGGVTLDGGTLRAGGGFTSARGFTIGAGGGGIDTGANALTLSGTVAGGGSLTKTGSGTLTLGGNGAGFTGTTRVNAGTLNLGGTLGGAVVVASGATLTGTGTAASLDIAGTVSPGNSPGTLTTTGDVVFRAGSTYRAELAASGAADRINAGGRITIEGGTVAITTLDPDTSYTTGTSYRILNAGGGLTGTFTTLTESSAFLDFALRYDATGVSVAVTVIRTFPDVALTFNQRESSRALAAFGQTAGSDSLAVYNAILLLDAGPARAAFDAASGEIYPATLGASQRRGMGIATQLIGRANAESGEGLGIWGGANGQDGAIDGDGNGGRLRYDNVGGDIGIDYRGADNRWAVGIAGGYRAGDVRLASRGSNARLDGWNVGGYVRYGSGGAGLTVTASGAYTDGQARVTRVIAIPGLTPRTARSRVDAATTAIAGELRYGLPVGENWAVGAVARVSYADTRLGRFTETGADSLNLGAGANGDDRTRYGGGLFARWTGGRGSIDATAAYLGGGGSASEVGLAMAGAGATPYRVRAARGDGDGAAFTLAGRYDLGGGWAVGATIEGAYGRDERNLQGNATLRWRF